MHGLLSSSGTKRRREHAKQDGESKPDTIAKISITVTREKARKGKAGAHHYISVRFLPLVHLLSGIFCAISIPVLCICSDTSSVSDISICLFDEGG